MEKEFHTRVAGINEHLLQLAVLLFQLLELLGRSQLIRSSRLLAVSPGNLDHETAPIPRSQRDRLGSNPGERTVLAKDRF
jgi:hypothetical protein